jgi:outer membrane receptor protein involved in Fe transport
VHTGLDASGAPKVDAAVDAGKTQKPADAQLGASHIRRAINDVDGAKVVDSPLRVDLYNRDYFQLRRQLGGIAPPDTAAALGVGGAGTARFDLRLQPTLILLNGRRMVSAPVIGPNGTDFVDTNQIPLQLIERGDITNGPAAGLWGADAMGGVVNFVTRRDIDGINVELGGQATDKLDQGDMDVTVTLGTVGDQGGANLLLSYFNRQPLAASDRDWIGEREDRVESLLGAPANFQKLTNGDYPISDPNCDLAQRAGQSDGYEVRLRGYGPVGNFPQLDPDLQQRLMMNSDGTHGPTSTRMNGVIDPLETATYCAVDTTGHNDLILKDEHFQSYGTLWHPLSKHSEVYAEAGYYRSENENRAAAAFPNTRITPLAAAANPLVVPAEHADQPLTSYGFAVAEVPVDQGRTPGDLFFFGRTQGNWNGDGHQERRLDTMRGVLGVRGDLAGLAPTGPVSTWNWDLSGTFSRSDQVSRVDDTLIPELMNALESCDKTRRDPNTGDNVPTTIKERQEAGCFSPFYSSVVNNAAVDPLNVSAATAKNVNGNIDADSDPDGAFGHGLQDGGYICDPNDPNSPQCPASFDRDGDGVYELAGTPNTKQVIDRITGEHYEVQQRTLGVICGSIAGDLATFGDGSLAFEVGAEYRHESLFIDYDQAYNQREYGFLFGGDDVDPIGRGVVGANLELRLRLANGLLEVQPAAKAEIYDKTGTGLNAMLGISLRPFASSKGGALEWLGLRATAGIGAQPPSLIQLYGQQNEFVQVDYHEGTQFIAHQISGNPDLDFEHYTTIDVGPEWDYAGVHVGVNGYITFIDDMIAGDNSRTLVSDCEDQFASGTPKRCRELILIQGFQLLDHVESRFDNLAKVTTNGVDGTISYTLDSKRRGLGDFGTFVLAAQGSYINSYLIESARALPQYYRDNAPVVRGEGPYPAPAYHPDGTRDYSKLHAEYDAAGFRNYENFAPPIPQLRFSVPLRWMYDGHTLGATVRYVGGYNDDSEYTIEKRNLPGIDRIQFAEGEAIPAWTVLDAMYGFAFQADGWKGGFTVGVLNLLDNAPPAVEGPLGYEVGLTDPRGRTLYVRLNGDF